MVSLNFSGWLAVYNTKRPHQGRDMNGRTPLYAFTDGLPGGLPGKAAEPTRNPKGDMLTTDRNWLQCSGNPRRLTSLQNAKLSGEYRLCTYRAVATKSPIKTRRHERNSNHFKK